MGSSSTTIKLIKNVLNGLPVKKSILVVALGTSNSISIYPWLNMLVGTLIL